MKILLVEDEPLQRESIAILCARIDSGMEVLEARDGNIALAILERESVDLVLSDIKMPRMNGLDLAAKIHSAWPQIRIVILTGYATFEYAREALRYGVVDYLLKPARYADLMKIFNACKTSASKTDDVSAFKENVNTTNDTASLIRSASEYIRQHYAENISLSSICELFHMNTSYFSEQFRRYIGEGFAEFLTKTRMEQARILLQNYPERSVTDIAFDVGYSDSRYFGTVFRKLYGITPMQHRKEALSKGVPNNSNKSP